MHQPALAKPTKADRATFRGDFHFSAAGGSPYACFRAAAEDLDPSDLTAMGQLVRRDLEAERAAEWLMRTVNDYRLKRASRDA